MADDVFPFTLHSNNAGQILQPGSIFEAAKQKLVVDNLSTDNHRLSLPPQD